MSYHRIRGIELYVEEAGEGSEYLLLLHGLGSSSLDWEYQVPAFRSRYRLLIPDLRGHGRSSKPPAGYSILEFAEDIAALVDQLKVGPLHIVGLSLGGMVGLQLAVSRPDLCGTLTVVNSIPDISLSGWLRRLLYYQRLALIHLFGLETVARRMSWDLFPKESQRHLREKLVRRWTQNDKAAYVASFRAIGHWSVLRSLGSIRCPVLVVSGDADYSSPEEKLEWVRRIPRARLEVVPDSRHATPADQADIFNQVVLAFLESTSLQQSAILEAITRSQPRCEEREPNGEFAGTDLGTGGLMSRQKL